MPQLGTIRFGGADVPYFDIGDVTGEKIRVQEGGTKGAINLLPRPRAAFPSITIQHPQTGELFAPHDAVYQVIDHWERGNANPYSSNRWSPDYTVDSFAAYQGNYGLNAKSGVGLHSMPGDGLNHYPGPGETFEYYFRVDANRASSNTNLCRFEFGMQEDLPQTNSKIQNGYRVEIETEPTDTSSISFERINNGTRHILWASGSGPRPQVGRWERVRIEWPGSGNQFSGRWETANGNTTQATWTVNDSYGTLPRGGIRMWTTNAVDVSYDHFQTVPGGA